MEKLTNNQLLQILEDRFNKNMTRHNDIKWEDVLNKLLANEDKLLILNNMEATDGEPDVVGFDGKHYLFFDCSIETPNARVNVCYDHEALESRKKFKPLNSAVNMTETIGSKLLNEDDYRLLQELGNYDLKTSSWLETPLEVRKLGGAIFGDKRFGRTFIYHNGADSYYKVRGFRTKVSV